MGDKYILEGRTPVPCDDIATWGRWFENAKRNVAKTQLANGLEISTVFLGMDHNFRSSNNHVPLLFETMTFPGGDQDPKVDVGDNIQDRCSTWEQAEEQHVAVCLRVMNAANSEDEKRFDDVMGDLYGTWFRVHCIDPELRAAAYSVLNLNLSVRETQIRIHALVHARVLVEKVVFEGESCAP